MKRTLILALVLLLAIFSFTSCDSDDDDEISTMPSGSGTASDPYVIKTADQFINLGSSEIQAKVMGEGNKDLHFRLDADIGLRGKSFSDGYAVYAISGEFDGNGKTIIGNNDASVIFKYAVDEVTFKDFDVDFDSSSVTKVFGYPLLLATYDGEGKVWKYDSSSVDVTFDDVDYEPTMESVYYDIGDNNASLYFGDENGTCWAIGYDKDANKKSMVYFGSVVLSADGTTKVKYNAVIKDCDVEGNYIGGFGGSGAAIYYGGQLYGTDAKISDSKLSGT